MSVTSDHHSGRNPLATDGRGSPPAAVIPLALAENRRDERGRQDVPAARQPPSSSGAAELDFVEVTTVTVPIVPAAPVDMPHTAMTVGTT